MKHDEKIYLHLEYDSSNDSNYIKDLGEVEFDEKGILQTTIKTDEIKKDLEKLGSIGSWNSKEGDNYEIFFVIESKGSGIKFDKVEEKTRAKINSYYPNVQSKVPQKEIANFLFIDAEKDIVDVRFLDGNGNRLWAIAKYGEKVKVHIQTRNMAGTKIKWQLYWNRNNDADQKICAESVFTVGKDELVTFDLNTKTIQDSMPEKYRQSFGVFYCIITEADGDKFTYPKEIKDKQAHDVKNLNFFNHLKLMPDPTALNQLMSNYAPLIIGEPLEATSGVDCGQKYCIKKGDKGELIREINIRLAGFGGNVPTDEFTDRTEKMIKQFQRDYMKVPETGRICGNVLKAIDEFTNNYKFTFDEIKCKCSTKGRSTKDVLQNRNVTNNCSGFGDGSNKNRYVKNGNTEKHHAYEYPGLHRSLLNALKAVIFYMDKVNTKYKYHSISSGFRCRFHSIFISSQTTNHMGKALDILFDYEKGGRAQKKEDLDTIRKEYFEKYLNATYWTGTNNFGLETYAQGAKTWVHVDVREFESQYLDEKYFCKTESALNGKGIVQLARELGYSDTCNCLNSYTSNSNSSNTNNDCQSKFDKISKIILKHEGGLVDHPNDKGGLTNKGITLATWKKYAKEDVGKEPTEENLKNISDDDAKIIYRKRYWEPKGFCKVNDDKVGLMVYDWTITSGGAAKKVQQLLIDEFNQSITADGAIGDKTIEAINNVEDQNKLLERIGEIRKEYYTNLTINDPSQKVFLTGWHNRVDSCLNANIK